MRCVVSYRLQPKWWLSSLKNRCFRKFLMTYVSWGACLCGNSINLNCLQSRSCNKILSFVPIMAVITEVKSLGWLQLLSHSTKWHTYYNQEKHCRSLWLCCCVRDVDQGQERKTQTNSGTRMFSGRNCRHRRAKSWGVVAAYTTETNSEKPCFEFFDVQHLLSTFYFQKRLVPAVNVFYFLRSLALCCRLVLRCYVTTVLDPQ